MSKADPDLAVVIGLIFVIIVGDDNSDGMLVYYLYIIPVGLMLLVGIITFVMLVIIFTKVPLQLKFPYLVISLISDAIFRLPREYADPSDKNKP